MSRILGWSKMSSVELWQAWRALHANDELALAAAAGHPEISLINGEEVALHGATPGPWEAIMAAIGQLRDGLKACGLSEAEAAFFAPVPDAATRRDAAHAHNMEEEALQGDGNETRRGLVQLSFGDNSVCLTPDEARDVARSLFECAESAEGDEIAVRFDIS